MDAQDVVPADRLSSNCHATHPVKSIPLASALLAEVTRLPSESNPSTHVPPVEIEVTQRTGIEGEPVVVQVNMAVLVAGMDASLVNIIAANPVVATLGVSFRLVVPRMNP